LTDFCVVGGGVSAPVAVLALARAGAEVTYLGQRVPGPPAGGAEPGWAYARRAGGAWTRRGADRPGCCVDGGAPAGTRLAFRYRTVDFRPGRYLTDCLPPDWPTGAADLAPYYDRVADLSGAAGPPAAESPAGAAIAAAAAGLGLAARPVPLLAPSGVDLTGRGSWPHVRLHPAAIASTVSPRSGAVDVECLDPAGRRRFTLRAGTLLVCADAVQSAALLLRSAAAGWRIPSPLVGAGLSLQPTEYAAGWLPGPADPPEPTGPGSAVTVADRALSGDRHEPLGGLIVEASPPPPYPGPPGMRLLRLECVLGDRPLARNRVRLAAGTDRLGLARIILDYRIHQGDERRLRRLVDTARAVLAGTGARGVHTRPGRFTLGTLHALSTCRMAAAPHEGVVDFEGRVFGTSRVYVLDGACHPFAGGAHSAFTIQANALRLVDRLLRRG
jgi:paromamine 6'-oxidase/6'''-hydroxyneomycin C oxidase/2'-deamino-2'-hydroxyparomamine 6'-oxidase